MGVTTTPSLNATIVDILRKRGGQECLYAAQRIEELEAYLLEALDNGLDDYWAVVNQRWVAEARKLADPSASTE